MDLDLPRKFDDYNDEQQENQEESEEEEEENVGDDLEETLEEIVLKAKRLLWEPTIHQRAMSI